MTESPRWLDDLKVGLVILGVLLTVVSAAAVGVRLLGL